MLNIFGWCWWNINWFFTIMWTSHMKKKAQVVLISCLGIRKWHGCKTAILHSMYPPPKDFVFHLKVLRVWKGQATHEWWQRCGNVYFHFNIKYLQKQNNDMTIEDITISDDTFAPFNTDHSWYLNQKGFLQGIVSNKKFWYTCVVSCLKS